MLKRAIISVSNRTGLIDFAQALKALDFEIISTGGTARFLEEAGVPVTLVTEITGFPEILGGRVKTLHPKIHGGILAQRTPEHLSELAAHGIPLYDLVAVNLYPFTEMIKKPEVGSGEALEFIDIGGPTLLRAAAKNYQNVIVVVNPVRYPEIIAQLREGEISLAFRQKLALEVFAHTAFYDASIAHYLAALQGEIFPPFFVLRGEKVQDLRYGENPHQKAAFYRLPHLNSGVAFAEKLSGPELSFNNLMDLEAAYDGLCEFTSPAAVVIKHTNPCGVAVAENLALAYQKAFAADPVSAFGGIVGLNREVEQEVAELLTQTFLEAVIAPSYTPEALSLLKTKGGLRVLALPLLEKELAQEIKTISGGFLVQETDAGKEPEKAWEVVTLRKPTPREERDLCFAWQVVRHVKSNAIVVAKDEVTLGVGAGQMNRVGAAKIALAQAGEKSKGAVLASDAFLPFADTVEEAGKAGVSALIQPGGSVRDEESIAAANKYGMAMIFTHRRHFKH